ncbi:MAG: hypothetical protein JO076_08690 [Verrucomicrobia bacterium]|nr:hypothetical protein [Verrucomicrobiota bacterium]
MIRNVSIFILAMSGPGCEGPQRLAPSIDVFGSYFPAWLISLASGVILTTIAAGLAPLINLRVKGFAAFVLSVSLILIFSITVWFWLFASSNT